MIYQGKLRPGVEVLDQTDQVVLKHQFIQLALPKRWVKQQPAFGRLLLNEISLLEIQSPDRELQSVLTFMEQQDFFFQSKAKASYTLAEVRQLFEPIAKSWYAQYYQHSLWDKLRAGTLPLNGFLAWVIHNYHISRAAGLSGARCAIRFPKVEQRPFFRKDVLEEYWHCDAYYFIRHPQLSLSDSEIKQYIPLPASLAFEQHALKIAESNWLAHLLISYFQESSIRFYADCLEFYQQVETAYQLPDFFKNWQAHMQLDQDHEHAEHFMALLDTDEVVSHQDFIHALENAWLAFYYLLAALDQIEAEAQRSSEINLRHPTTFQATLPASEVTLHSSYMKNQVQEAIYGALSYARSHDAILLWGNLARNLEMQSPTRSLAADKHPVDVAIANLLWEAIPNTAELASLLEQLWPCLEPAIPISKAELTRLQDLYPLSACSPLPEQLKELLHWRQTQQLSIPQFNL